MKTFRKLHRRGLNEAPRRHFTTILGEVRRILGKPASPEAAAAFSSQDDFATAYLGFNLTRKAASEDIMSDEERADLSILTPLEQAELLRSANQQGLSDVPYSEIRARVAYRQRELLNEQFNDTFTCGYSSSTGDFNPENIGESVLLRAREICQDLLGSCPVSEVMRNASFGNGASASLKRPDAQREKKYLSRLTVTCGLHDIARKYVSSCPAWSESLTPKKSDVVYIDQKGLTLLPPSALKSAGVAVMDFVPKDAKTERVILKEPELNGYMQKGLGKLIRKRLRTYRYSDKVMLDGISLNTSGSLNSDLAQLGSVHGSIGTVDAKQASDSITIALCEFFLSDDWFRAVMLLRSDRVITPWGRHKLQMIGGMGNGFTFELESVIFYAIGLAASERSTLPFAQYYVSIHGDDLVIPSDCFMYVDHAFASAGVTINTTKTFTTGPFRESCGGHFFNGASVKPFYVKTQNGSYRGDWFWLANSLLLWLADRSEDFIYSHKGRDLLQVLLHVRQYAASNEPHKWTVGTGHSRRSGLFGVSFYKLRRGFPIARTVSLTTENEVLPDEGKYLAWLNNPTRVLSVLDLCRHDDGSDNSEYAVPIKGIEKERWTRLTSFDALEIPHVVAPLWQLCRDHNLKDF